MRTIDMRGVIDSYLAAHPFGAAMLAKASPDEGRTMSEIVLEATGGQFKNLAEVLAHVRRVVGPASAPSEENT